MNEQRTVDARGLSCPEPAMLTRQALQSLAGGVVTVLVDSGTSRDNIVRTAERMGWRLSAEQRAADHLRLVLER